MTTRRIDISTETHPDTFAIVDAADFEFLNQWKWRLSESGYAHRTVIVSGFEYSRWLHKIVLDAPDAVYGDHKNCNKLDCRRENLRMVDARQNSLNRTRNEKRARGVMFKGVYSNSNCATFTARIKIGDKSKYLGSFATQEAAAAAYDAAASAEYGEYAKLNFPPMAA